ncbi:PAS domain-containing hybrid sensor histidine kinase/response regulator [Mesoterricola sediminis]|uniref:histidine kinase n=1 Tax=Mesoterricola sediminis TaxID=2927980 RepID=A0AA48KDU1_9BACT|nr:PAS domain-containing protein [Mesoterricola sediminis]BDU77405.1 hypothetical protein METESE_23630 [Mesoterricola sediminis]
MRKPLSRPLAPAGPESAVPPLAARVLADFQGLLAQVSDYAVFMLDPQGRILTWNEGARRIKGWEAQEVLGRHFSLLYAEEDAALGKPAMELSLAEACGTYQEEGWRVRKDGARFMAHVVITSIRGRDGALEGFLKISRDLTPQREVEARLRDLARSLEETVARRTRELQESEARLQGFVRHATAAIAFKGTDRRYLLVNAAREALMARPAAEILGHTDLEAMPPGVGERLDREDSQVIATGRSLQAEERWVHGDGSTHDYITLKFPLAGADGANWGIGILSTDITERKAAEQAHLQSQKLESLGVLAGGIAHDFNNLLGAILGNLGMVQMDLPPEAPEQQRLETIERLLAKATGLARQMLAYSGRGSFEIRPLDLNGLVKEMTHLLSISISKKVAIRFALDAGIPSVSADAAQLQQVIMNLVINASDAIGERAGTITLRTGSTNADADYLRRAFPGQELLPGTYVLLEVTDDGSGMSAETQKRIFEPFFTTKFTGRGLGLSAILGIVKGHGGAIRVYSEPGRGTTFKLLFPAGQGGHAAPQPVAAGPGAFHGMGTVLVVDDEESIRAMASGLLVHMGFDALPAADGLEALLLFETHRADIRLVLLDLTMPHLDGAETFAALRARGCEVPVLLSSGYNEREAVDRFKDHGLAGFLQKPYRAADFMEAIKRALTT